MNTRVIGIDLAVSAQHKAVILDLASNSFIGKEFTFSNQSAELERLLQRARLGAEEGTEVAAMMEATGMSWYPVGVYLYDRGVSVYRVNGRQTRDLRRALSRYAGSDRIDAQVLAQLYPLTVHELVPWRPPSGEQLTLQRACLEYGRWRELDVAIQNRLSAYNQWAWGGLQRVVPAVARSWMYQHWYNPWRVCAAGLATLTAAWQAASPDQPAECDWLPGWLKRARRLTDLYGSPERVGYDQLQALIQRQLHLRQQSVCARASLSKELIQPLFGRLYPANPLPSLLGVGPESAATYMAFIHDIGRFPTLDQFRSWCGMVPRSSQSGLAQSKHLSLTHAGPNLVKATLYQNADIARQWDVQFAAIYYQQMVKYGKHHTQAVCACASHLANRIYALLTQHRPYQLRDVDGRPIDRPLSRHLCRTRFLVPDDVRQRNNKRAHRRQQEQIPELDSSIPAN